MPRMSKKDKLEWSFFIGEHGRKKYNKICLQCVKNCKQSFRAGLVQCPSAVWKTGKEDAWQNEHDSI